jgi:hypothetical protein
MNEAAWAQFRESRKPIPRKKFEDISEEESIPELSSKFLEGLVNRAFEADDDFKVITLAPPKGGLSYTKRSQYLDDPKYSDLPDFIDARGTENGVGVYESTLEGGTFIKELPVGEFDKVYEID